MTNLNTETVHQWDDLSESDKNLVVTVHANGLRRNKEKVARCFAIGRPNIVFGEGKKYCRIHSDSVDVMKIITREYL